MDIDVFLESNDIPVLLRGESLRSFPFVSNPLRSSGWPFLLKSVNSQLAQCQGWLSGGGRRYRELEQRGYISPLWAGGLARTRVGGRRRTGGIHSSVSAELGKLSVGARIRIFSCRLRRVPCLLVSGLPRFPTVTVPARPPLPIPFSLRAREKKLYSALLWN